ITEAVTNSYKHAFPDGRAGKIQVAIHKLDDESARLTISDDGVGYASVEDLPTTVVAGRGVGLSLISAFARQLGEELAVSGPPGTTISLRLRLKARPEAASAEDEAAEPDEAAQAEPAPARTEPGGRFAASTASSASPASTVGSAARTLGKA
ncbi:MAG: sensor histidine kinase, partial [Kiloniellales bacterium]|nr:sensor histidine kinase [Kiloniellales bacterium]